MPSRPLLLWEAKMAYTVPTIANFKTYFFRDFPYGTTLDKVTNQDITNALADAGFSFNEALFSTQANFTLGYLLLTAHYLVMNLRASSQGIAGQYNWLDASKSVGSVSEGFSIPQRILDNPNFAMLSKTMYGAKFLALILPQLIGNVYTTPDLTNA